MFFLRLRTGSRPVVRLALATVTLSLLLGLLAQRLLLEPGGPGVPASWLFALAVLLAVLGASNVRAEHSAAALAAGYLPLAESVALARQIAGVVLSLAGIGLAGWAGWLTWQGWQNIDPALPFYGGGILVASLGFALWDGYGKRGTMGRWRRRLEAHWPELASLLIVLAVGFVVTLIGLNDYPPAGGISWNDEAQMGKDAYNVLFHNARPWQFSTSIYPVVASFKLLGSTTYALRLPFALMGALLLLPFYYVARRFGGPVPALAATFLFAVSRWRIAFVRMVLPLTPDMLLELIAFACLLRATRSGGKAPYFWAGMALALGMFSHASFKLVPAFALLLLLVAALRGTVRALSSPSPERWRALRRRALAHAPGALIFLCSFVLFATPYFGIARRDPTIALTERFTTVMPTFFAQEEEGQAAALSARAQQVALFFNRDGESWPALNLPGTPALDPVTGTLFVLGLATSIVFFWRGWNVFTVAWFLVMVIGGGVFTVDLRSHRFADAMPAAYLLAGSFVALAWQAYRRADVISPAPPSPRETTRRSMAFGIVLGVLLALAAWLNLGTFFGQQIHDARVRLEFQREISSIATTIAGFEGNRYVYLFANFPYYVMGQDFAWMAGEPAGQRAMSLTEVLPSRAPAELDLAYIFSYPYSNVGLEEVVRAIYPGAQSRYVESPYGNFSYSVVTVDRTEIDGRRGLTARYWRGREKAGPPAVERRELSLDTRWQTADAPLEAPFVVEWRGALYAPGFATYELALEGTVRGEIRLDERIVSDDPIRLAQGWHALETTAYVESLPAEARLVWTLPAEGRQVVPASSLTTGTTMQGIVASFFIPEGGSTSGEAVMSDRPVWQRIDPVIALQGVPSEWERGPIPQLAGKRYTASYEGTLHISQVGLYEFKSIAQGGTSSLSIDGRPVLSDAGAEWRSTTAEGLVSLGQGQHALKLTYTFQQGEFNGVALYWRPPGSLLTLVPPEAFVVTGDRPLEAAPPAEPDLPPERLSQAAAPGPEGSDLTYVGRFGGEGAELGQLREPWRMTRLSDGRLVVVDKGNKRLAVFDRQGKPLATWGQGELREPFDVAAGLHGSVLVLDSVDSVVLVYDGSGRRVGAIGEGLGLYSPRGLTVGLDGMIYVADTGSNRVMVFSAQGNFLRQIGQQGSATGQFEQPAELTTDAAGRLYVLDTVLNKRVALYDAGGIALDEWPLPWASDFIAPGVAYDDVSDTFYFVDPERSRLYHYAPDGLLLEEWGPEAFGEARPVRPIAVYVDGEAARIYLVDAGQHAVLMFDR